MNGHQTALTEGSAEVQAVPPTKFMSPLKIRGQSNSCGEGMLKSGPAYLHIGTVNKFARR